ncbi:hypothetical protein BHE74_00018920 [Ensete ventricosum]|nr:hypothetical protein GW17_00057659 [Ensete ventricosum]RWW73222.1 hypothetical protein BHE74_00018920 [Ensete ventricosum]RZR94669.1 hypothetical protein BHM03_00023422 [Ensete ventricosum]
MSELAESTRRPRWPESPCVMSELAESTRRPRGCPPHVEGRQWPHRPAVAPTTEGTFLVSEHGPNGTPRSF